jgi:hypothetical protein
MRSTKAMSAHWAIFRLKSRTIFQHVTEARWTRLPQGRPGTLSPGEMATLRGFLMDQFRQRTPASYADINDFLLIETGKSIPIDTVRHLVRDLPGFKIVIGMPTEEERALFDPQEVGAYFERLECVLVDFPADMVVNLDETGHCEWVDAAPEPVVIPADFPDLKIRVPIKRQSKQSTLLGAITADGGHLKPLVIIHRDTIETELCECGFTPDRVCYRSQENAFITSALFAEWAEEVLSPYFDDTRLKLRYDGPGLVLMDGCTCHSEDGFLDECTWRGIEILLLSPHTRDQVQRLDLGIFGL